MPKPGKILITLVMLWFSISICKAQQQLKFQAADFEIEVKRWNPPGIWKEINLNLLNQINKKEVESTLRQSLANYKISGIGTTILNGKNVKVRFNNVVLKSDDASNQYALKEGQVISTTGVSYKIDDCTINIKSGGLIINPMSAEAELSLSYKSGFIVSEDSIFMNSEAAQIFVDGSVCSKTFHSASSFSLTGGSLKFKLDESENLSVSIGKTSNCDLEEGIFMRSRSVMGTLDFISTIQIHLKESWVNANSRLVTNVSIIPECQYLMDIFAGTIRYHITRYIVPIRELAIKGVQLNAIKIKQAVRTTHTWDAINIRNKVLLKDYSKPFLTAGLKYKYINDISGQFKAAVTIPASVPDAEGNPVIINDINFNFDDDESISATVSPPSFMLLPCIKLIPNEIGGWMYFAPGWFSGNTIYECEKQPQCSTALNILATRTDLTRPGLTIFNGQLEYNLQQVKPGTTLHSPFWGCLTVMPYGLTGNCTSGGFSIVPENMNDTVIMVKKMDHDLQDIIKYGNTPPPDIKSIYKLAGLEILDMTLDSLSVCNNELNTSKFNYTVHFKHPSYFNIDFVDRSLTSQGFFKQSYGPDLDGDLSIEEMIGITNDAKPEQHTLFNAKGYFFWFWHLPVLFYENGVKVNFEGNANKVAIFNADLLVAPLSNKDATRKGGISFKGLLKQDGILAITRVDSSNYFGKLGYRGFESTLTSLKLAQLDELPQSRAYDLTWEGEVKLPFFKTKPIKIEVKDLIARQVNKMELDATGRGPADYLRVITDNLKYNYEKGCFEDFSIKYFISSTEPPDWTQTTVKSGNLTINSFTDGIIISFDGAQIKEMLGETSSFDDCGQPLHYEQWLISNSGNVDIICYDDEASVLRTEEYLYNNQRYVSCSNYKIGTYELRVGDEVVWKVPNVKYYMDTKIFETAQSNSDFKPHENDLDVGLDLKFVELHIANGEIEGKLALSTDDYPLDLPISGSSTTLFRVNTNCGYFYFFSEAKLNFGYKFNGMVFIAHELFQNLDHTIGGYNSPLEEVSRNIYLSKEDFLVLIDKPEQGNLLTGFMGTGGVGIDVLGFDVTLKGGFFCFNIHRFENGSNRDKLGVVNAIMATVDLPGAEAAVSATISASASFSNPQLDLRGKLCFCGCLEADVPLIGSLGYLLANASVGCWLSTEDGFGFDEIGFGADAGFGDCPCDEDPCP